MKYSPWKVLWAFFILFCVMCAMVRPGWHESDRLILIVVCAISVQVTLAAPRTPTPAENKAEAAPSQTEPHQ